jgi:hypothetical protein
MTPPKKIVGTIVSPETKRLLLSFPSLKITMSLTLYEPRLLFMIKKRVSSGKESMYLGMEGGLEYFEGWELVWGLGFGWWGVCIRWIPPSCVWIPLNF